MPIQCGQAASKIAELVMDDDNSRYLRTLLLIALCRVVAGRWDLAKPASLPDLPPGPPFIPGCLKRVELAQGVYRLPETMVFEAHELAVFGEPFERVDL